MLWFVNRKKLLREIDSMVEDLHGWKEFSALTSDLRHAHFVGSIESLLDLKFWLEHKSRFRQLRKMEKKK